jgi:hypothetical protein
MSAKAVIVVCAFIILSSRVAIAGPCSTGQTTGNAGQEGQRQEHAQPSVAEQPKSAGTTGQPEAGQQAIVPSSKMTDTDQSAATATPQGSAPSNKMADQDC